MKLFSASALLLSAALFSSIATSGPTEAQQTPLGGYMTKKDPQGKAVKVKATGKYSDCVRDGQKMGNSYEAAKRYCDGRRAAGWVK